MNRKKLKIILAITFIAVLILIFKKSFTSKTLLRIENQSNFTILPNIKNVFNFDYILESSPCQFFHNKVMLITSYIGHVELRSAHRQAFSSNDLEKFGIKRVFLLAKHTTNEEETSQKSIENEQSRFGDIVQGDFYEAYRNLTLKHVMGLRWASVLCSNVDYIIKLDDDIIFNIQLILELINTIKIDKNDDFLMGYILKGTKPIRLKENKWYVTKNEYSKSFYPPFLSGWMYLTTPKTAKSLLKMANETPFFWIDDVYITGILASKNHMKLQDIRPKHIFLEYFELMDCCMTDMLEKNIMCEYAVGPNGNDNNMLVKFTNAVNACKINKCIKRPLDRPLNDTCVSIKKSFPINKGIPVVNLLKL